MRWLLLALAVHSAATLTCSQESDAEFKQCLEGRVHAPNASPLQGIAHIHVVNLDRRPERLAKFHAGPLKPHHTNRFPAVDKMDLVRTGPIVRMFERSDYNYRRGIVACALSHYALWRHIARTTNQVHLVLEDDATFQPGFVHAWNDRYAYALPNDTQLLYLGGLLAGNSHGYKVGTVLEPVNRAFMRHLPTVAFSHDYFADADAPLVDGRTRRFHYTTLAYALSSEGARAMVNIVESMGFRRGADHMLYRLMDHTEHAYAASPLLAFPAPATATDIQTDMESVPLPADHAALAEHIALTEIATVDLGPTLGGGSGSSSGGGGVPAFVVNLDRSPDRLAHFAAQARQAGVRVTRFAAVDGSKLDMAALVRQGILGARYPANWRGSAACALSHYMLYEQLLAGPHSHYLIFEDDAFLGADFVARARAAVEAAPAGWDIVNFGCFNWSCSGTTVAEGIMAADTQCVSGTSAYVVTRAGAQTMLDVCLPMQENIDKQSRAHYGSRLKVYCTVPALSEQNWYLRPDRITHDSIPAP